MIRGISLEVSQQHDGSSHPYRLECLSRNAKKA